MYYLYDMYRCLQVFVFAILFSVAGFAQSLSVSPYGLESSDRNPSHSQVITYYKAMDAAHKSIQMATIGSTDTDDSLHVVYYSHDGKFDVSKWKKQDRIIIFINNGIHPGEPDGIVASMQLLWDIAEEKVQLPKNVVLAIVPIFNISGAKQLRYYTRANQNGPAHTGFRGNAQNLDLNRDFIKMDANETRSLVRLFTSLDPEVLIDNHVSNGADYQHVMTLLSTQHGKLGGVMGDYLNKVFEPALYTDMKKRGFDLVPYVNVWGGPPDNGWESFIETPRFLSGYAAMHHTYAFVPETHMLKPFPDRVKATYALMQSIIQHSSQNAATIHQTRAEQRFSIANSAQLHIDWAIDTTKPAMIELKGYKAAYRPSNVSGHNRLYYSRNMPFVKQVPYYNACKPIQTVSLPQAYVIPKAWNRVVERLKDNGVQMEQLKADTIIKLAVYYIADYTTTPKPYEGHYLHSNVKVNKVVKEMQLFKGDYIIPVAQATKRYIVEVLEPTAPDAFFAWGFFDAVLQQKEHYSDYAFEDLAVELLDRDKSLKAKLDAKRTADSTFAKDGRAQLNFVFQNSEYHEPEHMRYPVYRVE